MPSVTVGSPKVLITDSLQKRQILDASVGGFGGCPFAPAATGNIATEDLHYALCRSGHETGLDYDRLVMTTRWLEEQLTKLPQHFSGEPVRSPIRIIAIVPVSARTRRTRADGGPARPVRRPRASILGG